MAKGGVILITFPFTDLSGSKLLPAVALTERHLNITVCFITTQIAWQENTDVMLNPSTQSGIRKQSLIRTSKMATIDKLLAKGLFGTLNNHEILALNEN